MICIMNLASVLRYFLGCRPSWKAQLFHSRLYRSGFKAEDLCRTVILTRHPVHIGQLGALRRREERGAQTPLDTTQFPAIMTILIVLIIMISIRRL